MKKSLLFISLLILLLPSVLAIETTLKPGYQPGQTLIAEISGSFINNIKAEDIQFYSGRLFIPLIYALAKIQDKFYLYALLPNKERNYTLIIKNTHYLEAGEEKREDLAYNFTVSGPLALFSVNPGFIVTNKDFSIKVGSKVKTLDVIAEFLKSTQEVEVGEGREKILTFSVAEIKHFTFTTLSISAGDLSYEIPVVVFKQEEEKIEVSKNLRFSKSSANFTVLKDQKFQFSVTLINTGHEDIENIALSSDLKNIKIAPEKIEKLDSGTSQKINLTINSDEEGVRGGSLVANSENYSDELLLFISTLKDKEELENLSLEVTEEKSCSELNGEICDDEECEGITKLTLKKEPCCVGECKKKQGGGSKTLSLIVILIILVIIGIFIYRKLKFRKQGSNELLEKKSKSYEERFKMKSEEIKGGLSRV